MLRRVNGRHKEFPMSQTSRPPKGIGTATFTLAGIAAAFGLAACCALPFLLASVGLGAAWLAGVAVVAAPYRTPLLPIGAPCLIAGALFLTRHHLTAARPCAGGLRPPLPQAIGPP